MSNNCKHPHVVITVDFVQHAHLSSMEADETGPGIARTAGPHYGVSPWMEGWWPKAYFNVQCAECGYNVEYSSANTHTWPKWLTSHWLRLVDGGGLPAEIHRHYHMFQEAPCNPS